jgi:hypothetical protein
LDVVNIESDEFAAAQCASEADEYERSVSYVDQSVAEWCDELGDYPGAGSSDLWGTINGTWSGVFW